MWSFLCRNRVLRVICTATAAVAAAAGVVNWFMQRRDKSGGTFKVEVDETPGEGRGASSQKLWTSVNNSLENARAAIDNAATIIRDELTRLSK